MGDTGPSVDVDAALRRMIREYRAAGRERLLNETDLSARFGVSRNTLREALARAEMDGEIIRKRRVGTLIVKGGKAAHSDVHSKLQYPLDQVMAIPDFLRSSSQDFVIQSVAVTRDRAGTSQAKLLGIAEGAGVFSVRRRYTIDGRIAFVSEHLIPGVLNGRDIHIDALTDGVVNFLLEVENIRVHTVDHIVNAIAADTVLARDFEIAMGKPLLDVSATLFTTASPGREESTVVALGELIFDPDRFSLRATAT